MSALLIACGSALWFGVLTSVSPCPLATNLVAVSYVSRSIENPYRIFLTGVAYSLGRAITYLALASLIVVSLLSIPEVSFYLEYYMNRILGPLLIVAGLLLLEIIRLPTPRGTFAQRVGARAEKWGIAGAVLLGIVFALSFCPVSAALFFGSLIPLAVKTGSGVVLPSLYGLGTAVPVLAFSLLAAIGFKAVGAVFERVTRAGVWARRATALVFLAAGVYYTLQFTFEVSA